MVRISDGIGHLSTSAAVIKPAHKGLKRIFAMLEEPSVSEVRILCKGHIHERIVVLIHRHEILAIMRHQTGVQRLMMAMLSLLVMVLMFLFLIVLERNLPSSHDISFRHQFGIEHQIE